jgi:hypothetical protein
MAFVLDPEEDKQSSNTNQVQKQTDAGAAPISTGGGGGGGTAPAGGAGAPTNAGGFANLMSYLDANKDQANGVATTVAGNLGGKYDAEKGAIDSAATGAKGAAASGTTAFDAGTVNAAVANPAQFVSDPNNVSKFTAQRDATYKGPGSFQDTSFYGDAAKAADAGNQIGKLGASGNFAPVLSEIEKNPTAGKTALDLGLMQYDPTAQSTLQNAVKPFQGINDYLGGKATDVNSAIGDAKNTTADTALKTRTALTGREDAMKSDLTGRLQASKNDLTAKRDSASALLGKPSATADPAVLSMLGITPEQWSTIYAKENAAVSGYSPKNAGVTPVDGRQVNLGTYYKAPNPDLIGLPNVANADDFANSAALAQLSGDAPLLSGSPEGQPALSPFDYDSASRDLEPFYRAVMDARKQDLNVGSGGNIFGAI